MSDPGDAPITVEMCGQFADLAGPAITLHIPTEGCLAEDLLDRAIAALPALGAQVALGRVRICINNQIAGPQAPVCAADTVALFPPVSGG